MIQNEHPENMMLSERSQSQKRLQIVRFHLYEMLKTGKCTEIESRLAIRETGRKGRAIVNSLW